MKTGLLQAFIEAKRGIQRGYYFAICATKTSLENQELCFPNAFFKYHFGKLPDSDNLLSEFIKFNLNNGLREIIESFEYLLDQVIKSTAGTNGRLNGFPEKVKELFTDKSDDYKTLITIQRIRNDITHHRSFCRQDTTLNWMKPEIYGIYQDGSHINITQGMITTQPMSIHCKITTITKLFPRGEMISISQDELIGVCMYMHNIINKLASFFKQTTASPTWPMYSWRWSFAGNTALIVITIFKLSNIISTSI